MANNPISPLPADLPEDWVYGQTVAPTGAEVGLSQQHGYNYLMEQVNATQEAANALGAAFSGLATNSIYTAILSVAGWTGTAGSYTQAVGTIAGATGANLLIVDGASASDQATAAQISLKLSVGTAGALTWTARIKPETAITMQIIDAGTPKIGGA